MAFTVTAQITAILDRASVDAAVGQLKGKLQGITASVNVNVNPQNVLAVKRLDSAVLNVNRALNTTAAAGKKATTGTNALGVASKKATSGMNALATSGKNVASSQAAVGAQTIRAASAMEEFGRVGGLAIRRFAGFTIATGIVFGFIRAITSAISEAIKFDRELIRVAQVTGTVGTGLRGLTSEITRLSTTFGVSSSDLLGVSRILAQTGLSAKDTTIALEALAKSTLAPTFTDINRTAEGSIAILRQFKLEAKDLKSALGSINAVAGQFAVESDDIIGAVRRAGGVFASSSGVIEGSMNRAFNLQTLREFIATFTSVRATTRESAESIATGLRTIFTRIQRGTTVDSLRELGIELEDTKGNFIGPFKAINALATALEGLGATDPRVREITEELGGFRQVSKTIPLLAEMTTRMKALQVATEGQNSINKDAEKAQEALAIQITKVREEFIALVREISETSTFRTILTTVLKLTSGLIDLADAIKPIVPLLTIFGGIKLAGAATGFARGFFRGVSGRGDQPGLQANTQATTGQTVATKAQTTATAQNTQAQQAAAAAFRGAAGLATGVATGAGFRPGRNQGGVVFHSGGYVGRRYDSGGMVPGKGTSDTVNAVLKTGEYVIRQPAVEVIGRSNLEQMNRTGRLPFKAGGLVHQKDVGAAILKPPGMHEPTSTLGKPITRKEVPGLPVKSKSYNLIRESLPETTSKDVHKATADNFIRGINQAATKFVGKNKVPKFISNTDKQNLIQTIDVSSTAGRLFEGMLALIGKKGKFTNIDTPERPFDFINRLFSTSLLAKPFPLLRNTQYVDAKLNAAKAAPSRIRKKVVAQLQFEHPVTKETTKAKGKAATKAAGTRRKNQGGLIAFAAGGEVPRLPFVDGTEVPKITAKDFQKLSGDQIRSIGQQVLSGSALERFNANPNVRQLVRIPQAKVLAAKALAGAGLKASAQIQRNFSLSQTPLIAGVFARLLENAPPTADARTSFTKGKGLSALKTQKIVPPEATNVQLPFIRAYIDNAKRRKEVVQILDKSVRGSVREVAKRVASPILGDAKLALKEIRGEDIAGKLFEGGVKTSLGIHEGKPSKNPLTFDFNKRGTSKLSSVFGDAISTVDFADAKFQASKNAIASLKKKFINKMNTDAAFRGKVDKSVTPQWKGKRGEGGKGPTPVQKALGGLADGGLGSGDVPAKLTRGEFVIKASSARTLGLDTLNKLNQANKFHDGGAVGRIGFTNGGTVIPVTGGGGGAIPPHLLQTLQQLVTSVQKTATSLEQLAASANKAGQVQQKNQQQQKKGQQQAVQQQRQEKLTPLPPAPRSDVLPGDRFTRRQETTLLATGRHPAPVPGVSAQHERRREVRAGVSQIRSDAEARATARTQRAAIAGVGALPSRQIPGAEAAIARRERREAVARAQQTRVVAPTTAPVPQPRFGGAVGLRESTAAQLPALARGRVFEVAGARGAQGVTQPALQARPVSPEQAKRTQRDLDKLANTFKRSSRAVDRAAKAYAQALKSGKTSQHAMTQAVKTGTKVIQQQSATRQRAGIGLNALPNAIGGGFRRAGAFAAQPFVAGAGAIQRSRFGQSAIGRGLGRVGAGVGRVFIGRPQEGGGRTGGLFRGRSGSALGAAFLLPMLAQQIDPEGKSSTVQGITGATSGGLLGSMLGLRSAGFIAGAGLGLVQGVARARTARAQEAASKAVTKSTNKLNDAMKEFADNGSVEKLGEAFDEAASAIPLAIRALETKQRGISTVLANIATLGGLDFLGGKEGAEAFGDVTKELGFFKTALGGVTDFLHITKDATKDFSKALETTQLKRLQQISQQFKPQAQAAERFFETQLKAGQSLAHILESEVGQKSAVNLAVVQGDEVSRQRLVDLLKAREDIKVKRATPAELGFRDLEDVERRLQTIAKNTLGFFAEGTVVSDRFFGSMKARLALERKLQQAFQNSGKFIDLLIIRLGDLSAGAKRASEAGKVFAFENESLANQLKGQFTDIPQFANRRENVFRNTRAFSPAEIGGAAEQLTTRLHGGPAVLDLEKSIKAAKRIEDEFPALIQRVIVENPPLNKERGEQIRGVIKSIEREFSDIPDFIRNRLTSVVKSRLTSRKTQRVSDILEGPDIEKLFKDVGKAIFKAGGDLFESLTKFNQEYEKAIQQSIDIQLTINRQLDNVAVQRAENEIRLAETVGDFVSVQERIQAGQVRVRRLTEAGGIRGGTADVGLIIAQIRDLEARRADVRTRAESQFIANKEVSPATLAEFATIAIQLQSNTDALRELAKNTGELSAIQKDIADFEKSRAIAGKTLTELATGSPEQQQAAARRAQLAVRLASGEQLVGPDLGEGVRGLSEMTNIMHSLGAIDASTLKAWTSFTNQAIANAPALNFIPDRFRQQVPGVLDDKLPDDFRTRLQEAFDNQTAAADALLSASTGIDAATNILDQFLANAEAQRQTREDVLLNTLQDVGKDIQVAETLRTTTIVTDVIDVVKPEKAADTSQPPPSPVDTRQHALRESYPGQHKAEAAYRKRYGVHWRTVLAKRLRQERERKRLNAEQRLVRAGFNQGGIYPGYTRGGKIPGVGPNKDTELAMLSKGEFVVNREATRANRGLLEIINRNKGGKIPHFQGGGLFDPSKPSRLPYYLKQRPEISMFENIGRALDTHFERRFPGGLQRINDIATKAALGQQITPEDRKFIDVLPSHYRQLGSEQFRLASEIVRQGRTQTGPQAKAIQRDVLDASGSIAARALQRFIRNPSLEFSRIKPSLESSRRRQLSEAQALEGGRMLTRPGGRTIGIGTESLSRTLLTDSPWDNTIGYDRLVRAKTAGQTSVPGIPTVNIDDAIRIVRERALIRAQRGIERFNMDEIRFLSGVSVDSIKGQDNIAILRRELVGEAIAAQALTKIKQQEKEDYMKKALAHRPTGDAARQAARRGRTRRARGETPASRAMLDDFERRFGGDPRERRLKQYKELQQRRKNFKSMLRASRQKFTFTNQELDTMTIEVPKIQVPPHDPKAKGVMKIRLREFLRRNARPTNPHRTGLIATTQAPIQQGEGFRGISTFRGGFDKTGQLITNLTQAATLAMDPKVSMTKVQRLNILKKLPQTDDIRKLIKEIENTRAGRRRFTGGGPDAITRIDAKAGIGAIDRESGRRLRAIGLLNKGGFIGFQGGGLGPDTQPAMLTKGEFVVNKKATDNNLALLHAINNGNVRGFQFGGDSANRVAPQLGGVVQQPLKLEPLKLDSAAQEAFKQFNAGTKAFASAVTPAAAQFTSAATKMEAITTQLANFVIPETIQLQANHRVEVIFNGAEVMASLPDEIAELAIQKAKEAIRAQINPVTGETEEGTLNG